MTHFSTEAKERKAVPLATGVVDYFPDALIELAALSKKGNDQHNPGQPLHWARGKSDDHPDCLMRHFVDRGSRDNDGMRHSAKVAWRALAILQLEIESDRLETLAGPQGRIVSEEGEWEAVNGRAPNLPGETLIWLRVAGRPQSAQLVSVAGTRWDNGFVPKDVRLEWRLA